MARYAAARAMAARPNKGTAVYARLTAEELAAMPANQEPTYLVPETKP
ncbi:MAG: hypothetical protein SCG79_06605 [Nitrosomonadaceae bacterium]|nr:hypothetical protein [Nitrosomonadaceae bacterium]MDW7597840.1 hypothetical protein [Nitrosomonadaceae bacterium]MDW7647610.1 hypothetical protein [Nitrosomonadaceae bacterium]MDW7666111.1 hypothetical protein [Nitrosomonadaceae bacterium]